MLLKQLGLCAFMHLGGLGGRDDGGQSRKEEGVAQRSWMESVAGTRYCISCGGGLVRICEAVPNGQH